MDEPLSNLDAKLRVHMRSELSQLHRTLGATFLYVTHDQAEALTLSDRIAVMMEGSILQYDTPDEIYRNPSDLRVAEFVGSPRINMLLGWVRDGKLEVSETEHQALSRSYLDLSVDAPHGLGVALLIEAQKSFKDFYRTIFFLPVMATLIAMAISWQFILHPTFGFLNLLLKEFGLQTHNWLRTEGLALWVLAAIGIWNQFGFNMVLFLAGLVSIPRHLYDAAAMDGASSAIERFRLVTWPLLGPVTLFVVVITTIRSFQVFDTVAILTKGGPSKSTEVLLYTMYAEGFEFFKSGYASAVTIVFLVIVLALTLIKTRYLEKKVHYA